MADIQKIVGDMIRMAAHPASDPVEAQRCALKACQLIEKYSLPVGSDVIITADPTKEWKPPTVEENSAVEDLLKGKDQKTREQANREYRDANPSNGGMITQDNTPMTGFDAFRQRLIDAWRALREERKNLDYQIYEYEQRTRSKYTKWSDQNKTSYRADE